MLKALSTFSLFVLVCAFLVPAASKATGLEPSAEMFLGVGGAVLAVGAAASVTVKTQGGGILGFNTYSLNFLNVPVADNVGFDKGDATDVLNANLFCKMFGYLWRLSSRMTTQFLSASSLAVLEALPKSLIETGGITSVHIETKYRLPADFEPIDLTTNAAVDGGLHSAYDAAKSTTAALVSVDQSCTDIVQNLEKKILNRGDLVVAILEATNNISDQTEAQLIIPMCAGQKLVVAIANANAQEGVYDNPFAAADGVIGKAFIGKPGARSNVPVLIAGA